ncbi:MAG TPA: DUF6528 family protein [Sphingobacteriaceae bacterium]
MKLFFASIILVLLFAVQCKKASTVPVVSNPETPVIPDAPASVAECKKCLILSEQLHTRVAIADVASKKIIWEWSALSSDIKPESMKWFSNISDAKLVYSGKYILMNASGGAVALIRIADKKVMFYAFAGGNTHSAELLPDGNIVSASSTGNYLALFKVDTLNFPYNVYSKKIPIDNGHNVVWDHRKQILWSAAMNKLKSFKYNFNCSQPDLTPDQEITLPGTGAHDLFPVYGENALWLTTSSNVYKFDIVTSEFIQTEGLQSGIKSVSSGPSEFPVILIKPKTEWWTDEVVDSRGSSVFYSYGLKIYKARWLLENDFSYPSNNQIKQCK